MFVKPYLGEVGEVGALIGCFLMYAWRKRGSEETETKEAVQRPRKKILMRKPPREPIETTLPDVLIEKAKQRVVSVRLPGQ
jgi:hypothetical protein